MRAKLVAACFSLLIAIPALAEPPAADEASPFPPPDPMSWWTEPRPKPAEAADPLAGRRLGRREAPTPVDNAIEPSLYRLWGLPPLQSQVLHGEEMIVELWTHPALGVRQTVTRVTVRGDGKAFVQVRAGLGCCEPGIGRRVGFDAELPPGAARRFLALRQHPAWDAPRAVRVIEGDGAQAVCLDGAAYDLTLLVPGRSRSLRRACDKVEIGQIADIAEPVLAAALGHEPRIDVLFPGGPGFDAAREAYRALLASGGSLKADPDARQQPPGITPELQPQGSSSR